MKSHLVRGDSLELATERNGKDLREYQDSEANTAAEGMENRQRDMPLTHLRPTTPLEMLDRAFAVFRSRAGFFLMLGVCASAPGMVVQLGMFLTSGPVVTDETVVRWLPWQIASLFLEQWPVAALLGAAFHATLFPRRWIPVRVALQAAIPRLPHLILSGILVAALLALLVTAGIQAVGALAGGALGLLVIIWIVFGVLFLGGSWALVGPVVILEPRAFFRAMRRSLELMLTRFHGAWWRDSSYFRLALIVLFPVVVRATTLLAVRLAHFLDTGELIFLEATDRNFLIAQAIVDGIASILTTPWTCIAITLLYAECRMRREALDLEVRLLAQAGANHPEHGIAGL